MSDADLILPEPGTEEVTVVLAGLAMIQMQALRAGDLEKVTAAGNSMAKLADENPDQVRETLLENNQASTSRRCPTRCSSTWTLRCGTGRSTRIPMTTAGRRSRSMTDDEPVIQLYYCEECLGQTALPPLATMSDLENVPEPHYP